ncbi:MAG: type II toxin-antitoxin system RelE/ParE family toxin [Candidatus Uhrbacteria bacterium]|nr:type II toxin-antitoxin system RelE/ParE family toxin [Candidatus Uhrbacteria bacterium]
MRIIGTRHFERQCKVLGKRYRSIDDDVKASLRVFRKEDAQYLGAKLYKVRVRSSNIAKGKSGAFRLIVLCIEIRDIIVPVTLYQKSSQESITERELEYHLARIRAELKEII